MLWERSRRTSFEGHPQAGSAATCSGCRPLTRGGTTAREALRPILSRSSDSGVPRVGALGREQRECGPPSEKPPAPCRRGTRRSENDKLRRNPRIPPTPAQNSLLREIGSTASQWRCPPTAARHETSGRSSSPRYAVTYVSAHATPDVLTAVMARVEGEGLGRCPRHRAGSTCHALLARSLPSAYAPGRRPLEGSACWSE